MNWITALISLIGSLIISWFKSRSKKTADQVIAEQDEQSLTEIKHAQDIRADADELPDSLLIKPEARTSVGVLDLSPDLRGKRPGSRSLKNTTGFNED